MDSAEYVALLTASRVTPMVLALAHRSCPATAQIFGATGGYYCRYVISHTEGATFGPNPTVEDIAANWDSIRDGSLPNELDGQAMAWGVGRIPLAFRHLRHSYRLRGLDDPSCASVIVWSAGWIGATAVRAACPASLTGYKLGDPAEQLGHLLRLGDHHVVAGVDIPHPAIHFARNPSTSHARGESATIATTLGVRRGTVYRVLAEREACRRLCGIELSTFVIGVASGLICSDRRKGLCVRLARREGAHR